MIVNVRCLTHTRLPESSGVASYSGKAASHVSAVTCPAPLGPKPMRKIKRGSPRYMWKTPNVFWICIKIFGEQEIFKIKKAKRHKYLLTSFAI